ncbi:hypothetical protein ACRQ4C_01465 [Curtobacterium sp. SP.BCp]|uniref:hypothetical protein n=1 Tax=Curtobacterium sp. SP.BCp TaxID=3435230 RepID=UPI003F737D9C
MTASTASASPDGNADVVIAADRIFADMGAAGLDYDTVAAAAHVDVDIVQAAYPAVTDLVIAVLRYQQDQWSAGLQRAAASVLEPRDKILTLFSYLESYFMDDAWRGCSFINGYGELGRTVPAIADLAEQHLTSIETHLQTLAAAAGLPPFVADSLSLLVQGAKVEAAIHRTTQPARSARMSAAMLMSVYDPARHDLFI